MSGPFPLYDSTALRQAEARAASRLGDDIVLMQCAGLASWYCALAHWPQAPRTAVASGPGKTACNGCVLARAALLAGDRQHIREGTRVSGGRARGGRMII